MVLTLDSITDPWNHKKSDQITSYIKREKLITNRISDVVPDHSEAGDFLVWNGVLSIEKQRNNFLPKIASGRVSGR